MTPADLIGAPLSAIDTPALVLDLDRMEANLARIAGTCRRAGVGWRPHIKCHKSPDIAKRAIAGGAVGITCAKLSEAEAMVGAGIRDILIANQIVGPIKIARLVRLLDRAELAVAVDNPDNVRALGAACRAAGQTLRVVIEVDTGLGRAGVLPGDDVVALARLISSTPGMVFSGVMAWEGQTTRITDPVEKEQAIRDALGKLAGSAALCRTAGLPAPVVSCGGTGTFEIAAFVPGVTEIQAGGGLFGDVHYRDLYHVQMQEALTVMATVTSRPTLERIITDAGKKAMSCDSGVPEPLGLPPLQSVGFSAEHGKITLAVPSLTPGIGEHIHYLVGYADTTVHLHDEIYAVRHGKIEHVWPIPRGSRLR